MNHQEKQLTQMTVAEIVAADVRTADVFKNRGIDFCCGGGRTIEEVGKSKDINVGALVTDLQEVLTRKDPPSHQYSEWKPEFLIDFIENTHHQYVNNNLPLILEYSKKVASVHGEANPEVVEIYQLFQALAAELSAHLMKEERILFPYIKTLAAYKDSAETAPAAPFGTVKNPIRMMHHEHDNAGDIIKKIKELSNDFTPPEHACNTYKVLYHKLEEFQNDLFMHIHLENNILFPKAVELEQN